MSKTLEGITLPLGLVWSDKYSWTPISQQIDPSLTGALLVQEAAQSQGRPITLTGGRKYCRLSLAELDIIFALTQTPGAILNLDLGADGNHTVIWRRDPKPIEALPLFEYDDPEPADIYIINVLRFYKIG